MPEDLFKLIGIVILTYLALGLGTAGVFGTFFAG
jgi:hypothetical protein